LYGIMVRRSRINNVGPSNENDHGKVIERR
jgi:hypothetical protein